jgi:tRNA-splicing ligase RtcB
MSEPILITRAHHNGDALGFAPHGAGRNMGRKAFLRKNKGDE